MSAFTDSLLLQFLQESFVQDFLSNRLGLAELLNVIYEFQDRDLRQIELGGVQRREFEVPAFETIRTSGIDERLMPTSDRVKVDRAQPRYGRLAWVDVFLDVLLSTQVQSKAMPIDSITAQSLIDKLGGVVSLADLRTKLAALYPQSIVDAYLRQLRITSVDDFKRQPALVLEFL